MSLRKPLSSGFCDYLFEINVVSMVLGEENRGESLNRNT